MGTANSSAPTGAWVIDADGHVIEPPNLWPEYLEAKFQPRMPRPTRNESGRFCYRVDDRFVMQTASALSVRPKDGSKPLPLRAGGWDPSARLEDMDSEGIDVAVLFPTLSFFFPELQDAELHAALCRAYNDWLADYCAKAPERLIGVALLPLEDVGEALRELDRAVGTRGLRGAFVRPNPVRGRTLQHPDYDPLWARAAELRVPVTVHEGISDSLPTLGRDRTSNPALQHLMSHSFEQMAACAGLILGGVLERFPNLGFVFLESGAGWLPYWLARMDEHWETWSDHFPAVKTRPSDAFRRQCCIAMDPGDVTALSVLEQVGDDCLVWASDYPHMDAPFPGAVRMLRETLARAPAESQAKVLGGNAARLFALGRR